jgi:formylglycine-generating enzyme
MSDENQKQLVSLGDPASRAIAVSQNGGLSERGLVIATQLDQLEPAKLHSLIPSLDPFCGKQAGEERDFGVDGPECCWCPPGSFVMGSPETEAERLENENLVPVSFPCGFWISKYVINGSDAYEAIVEDVKVRELPYYPATYVSFAKAIAYCRDWTLLCRAAKTLPQNWHFRLPTEAEWEYACRAGTQRPYSFGDEDAYHTNVDDLRQGMNGRLERLIERRDWPNAWSISNRHGVVTQWCLDAWSNQNGVDDARYGPVADYRAARGGHYAQKPERCRAASRQKLSADTATIHNGFRVVAVPNCSVPSIRFTGLTLEHWNTLQNCTERTEDIAVRDLTLSYRSKCMLYDAGVRALGDIRVKREAIRRLFFGYGPKSSVPWNEIVSVLHRSGLKFEVEESEVGLEHDTGNRVFDRTVIGELGLSHRSRIAMHMARISGVLFPLTDETLLRIACESSVLKADGADGGAEIREKVVNTGRTCPELNLSFRSRSCLHSIGITTTADLVNHSADDLLAHLRFPDCALIEIRRSLLEHGLNLCGEA